MLGGLVSSALGALGGDALLGAVSEFGGDVLKGGLGLWQANSEANAAKVAAAKSRSWMEYMSSTAHQREVADLRAAGLNPILSATHGGASSPQSSAAAVPSRAAYMQAVNSARSIASQVSVNKAIERKTIAEARVAEGDAQLKDWEVQRERGIDHDKIEFYIREAPAWLRPFLRSGIMLSEDVQYVAEQAKKFIEKHAPKGVGSSDKRNLTQKVMDFLRYGPGYKPGRINSAKVADDRVPGWVNSRYWNNNKPDWFRNEWRKYR